MTALALNKCLAQKTTAALSWSKVFARCTPGRQLTLYVKCLLIQKDVFGHTPAATKPAGRPVGVKTQPDCIQPRRSKDGAAQATPSAAQLAATLCTRCNCASCCASTSCSSHSSAPPSSATASVARRDTAASWHATSAGLPPLLHRATKQIGRAHV